MTELIIIGARHPNILRIVSDISSQGGKAYNVLGIVDNNWRNLDKTVYGCEVLGGFEELDKFPRDIRLVNVIAGSMAARRETTEYLISRGWMFETIVHPATSTEYVALGSGCIVYENALLQPFVSIGDHSVIASPASIGHETIVGSYVFIGPGSIIAGKVRIEDDAYVGLGAKVLPRLTLGSRCLIAAGAVVIKDVPPNSRVRGVPARPY